MLSSHSDPLGTLLKRFRIRRHLTQQKLAAAIGVHRTTIVRWEGGSVLPESKALVLELAKHLYLDDEETRHLLEASLTALDPYWSVPLPRNPFFTGREEVLEVLYRQLGVDQPVALIRASALHGLGGVGKTQIALEYAYRHALQYSAVFWIEAETQEQIVSSLLRIAEVLQLPGREDKDVPAVVAAVERWLSTHSQWLLIWDNVEDLDLLQRFLPATRSGAILLTTRLKALGTLARGIDLLPMGQQEGMLFLLRRAKVLEVEATSEQLHHVAECLPAQYAAVEQLVTNLGGLPLALDQAGAYVEATQCGLPAYLDLLRTRRTTLLTLRGEGTRDHPASVSTTFTLALRATVERHPAVLDLLRVCALLQPDAIPEELFRKGTEHLGEQLEVACRDPLEWDCLVGVACSYSLLARQPQARTLSMHRLVQAILLDAMTDEEREQWLLCVLQVLAHLFPNVSAESSVEVWKQCERLLPHVLTVSSTLSDDAEAREVAVVVSKAADYLRERAQYEQAEPLYQRALMLCEQAGEERSLLMAHVLNGLASLSTEQRKYAQAEHLGKLALHLHEQALGADHPETSVPLMTLGKLSWQRGSYVQAEPLFQRALLLREHALGEDHPLLVMPLTFLGLVYWRQGRYAQAEPLFQRALALCEQVRGPQHPQMLYTLTDLGLLYWKQGRYAQAESLFQQAIHLIEQLFGPAYHQLAFPLTGLAAIYAEQGKIKQADGLFRRVLHIREQALGPGHLLVAEALNKLAEISIAQDKQEQAEDLYLRAIALYEQGGETALAYPLHGLATLYTKQGKDAQAERLYRRALQIWEQAQEDSGIAATLSDLAQLYLRQEKHEEAEGLYQRVRSIREQSLGPDHSDTSLHKTVIPVSSENDPLQEFLTVCCDLHPRAWARSSDLWQAYQQWAQNQHEHYSLSRGAFIAQLKAHGCCADRTKTARIWRGIALVKTNDDSG